MEKEIVLKLSAILDVLNAINSGQKMVKPPDASLKNVVLNNNSLRELLKISPSTLRRWVKKEKLKYTLIQRTRFYLLEDVLAHLGRKSD